MCVKNGLCLTCPSISWPVVGFYTSDCGRKDSQRYHEARKSRHTIWKNLKNTAENLPV